MDRPESRGLHTRKYILPRPCSGVTIPSGGWYQVRRIFQARRVLADFILPPRYTVLFWVDTVMVCAPNAETGHILRIQTRTPPPEHDLQPHNRTTRVTIAPHRANKHSRTIPATMMSLPYIEPAFCQPATPKASHVSSRERRAQAHVRGSKPSWFRLKRDGLAIKQTTS